jgi:cruciform cutting endonuclease 1
MLYAALEAMKKERGGNLAGVGVYGIEPKRVVQYWGEKEPGFTNVEEGDDKKRKPTSREVKKTKIDTVARWLEAALSESETALAASSNRKIELLGEPSPPRTLAEAYLARLRTGVKRGPKVVPVLKDLTKLDDLADCLLQGVTWVEWMRMRELVLRKGVVAIEEN